MHIAICCQDTPDAKNLNFEVKIPCIFSIFRMYNYKHLLITHMKKTRNITTDRTLNQAAILTTVQTLKKGYLHRTPAGTEAQPRSQIERVYSINRIRRWKNG